MFSGKLCWTIVKPDPEDSWLWTEDADLCCKYICEHPHTLNEKRVYNKLLSFILKEIGRNIITRELSVSVSSGFLYNFGSSWLAGVFGERQSAYFFRPKHVIVT